MQDRVGASRNQVRRPTGVAELPPPARGRPRDPGAETAILRATLELLTEVGLEGATTNAIADRSRCSKSTIYRRWPSRDQLILDALRMASPGPNDDPGGAVELERALGSAVHAAAHQGAKTINSRLFRAVFPTIARELLADTESAQQFRADVFVPVRAAAKARMLAATEREEVAPAIDPDLLFDLIYGGLLYRVLFGLPVDDGVARALADLVMHGAAGRQYRKRAAAPETSPRSSTRDPRP